MIAKPLDNLQPSPFSIDDWKYKFLASENLTAAFQWFWENFDSEGWSIWEIVYLKTENEGKELLQTKNMVRGFLQSMDPYFKKYCFAIHGVYGDEPDLHIRGAWIWKGTEIHQYMDHRSFEYLQFNKFEIQHKQERLRFEEYWMKKHIDINKLQGKTTRFVEYFR